MAQAIMEPEKVRRFAEELQRFNSDLENRMLLLHALQPGSPIPFGHPDWILAPPVAGEIGGISVAAVIASCAPHVSAPAGNASC